MQNSFHVPHTSIEQFTLDNGLRVVLNQDKSVPVVSVSVYYDVGSRNEPEGRTGFAHLFEHMMFQGSENVPKAAHFQYISNAGGTMNGTTSSERTNYFETLPASELPLALWLESDRMRSLNVTQENLDNQREAVKEEKRLRYDNQPYVNGFLRLFEMSFKNPANAHSTIGSMEDLDAATVDDVREFFRVYYAPNNAVLSIAGDFDRAEADELIQKYFATIPSQPAPPPVDVSEPVEVAERLDTFVDKLAPVPGVRARLEDSAAPHARFLRAIAGQSSAVRRRKRAALSEAREGRRVSRANPGRHRRTSWAFWLVHCGDSETG